MQKRHEYSIAPGHSSEKCKVLKDYSKRHVAQRPFKYEQARYGGNKRGKPVKFESTVKEVNIMKSHDEPILRKKKGRSHNKKLNSDQAYAETSEYGRKYRLDPSESGRTCTRLGKRI